MKALDSFNNQKLLLIVFGCLILIQGCAYKKSLRFGPKAKSNTTLEKSDFNQMVDMSAQSNDSTSNNEQKEEGLFFKSLPIDYDPTQAFDSTTNRNASENF